MKLHYYVGIILTMLLCWYYLSQRVADIAADVKVIRATCTQQPLPVKGETPTLPKR
jgi:hypothetical protein